MKKLSLVFILSFILSGLNAGYSQNNQTDGNPFARYGTKVPVFTFSGGTEFHDSQRIVKIGSVKYDTRTHKVVGFIETNDTANCLPPEVTAMQPDPKAEKYYSISPYVYCLNNPVRYTDPDGRDVWEISQNGTITNRIKDKTQDAFFMVAPDKDGNYQRTYTTDKDGNKQYNSISFEYGTVESQKSISYNLDGKTDTYDEYKVRGDQNGSALFEFMGKNVTGSSSMVEVGLAQTGVEGDKGLNFITTGHLAGKEPGGSYIMSDRLYYGYTTRSLIHSHPRSDYPSGADRDYKSQVTGVMRQQGLQIPSFGIFHVKTNRYIFF